MLALVMTLCMLCAVPSAPTHETVDLELLLAVDVSASMDSQEFALQRAGYVNAIKDPQFIRAVKAGPNGRIAIAYFEWAGTPQPKSVLNWHVVDGTESARAFADELSARPFATYRATLISRALEFAGQMFGQRVPAERRVVDISGDGVNNAGLPVAEVRDRLVAEGIVINGLPIVIRPDDLMPIDRYYFDCVIGGPGAFMMPISSADQFNDAIRRKLITEVSDATPPVVLTADLPKSDCLAGDRIRQQLDRYFPELDLSR